MYQQDGLDGALQVVSDPLTEEKKLLSTLRQFHGDIEVAEAVARHPNCPFDCFLMFEFFLPQQTKLNPSREKYTQLPEWSDRYATFKSQVDNIVEQSQTIIKHWSAKPESPYVDGLQPEIYKLNYYFQRIEPKVACRLLELAYLPAATLEAAAQHQEIQVRKAAAKRDSAPEGVFEKLAQDKSKMVRMIVAKNPEASYNAFSLLVNDEDKSVAKAALENPDCPVSIIQKIKQDKATQLAERSVASLTTKEIYEYARNPLTQPQQLQELSNHVDPCVRYLSGLHANTSDEILATLAADKVDWVRESVAFNSKTPPHVLQQLASIDTEGMQIALASNPALALDLQLQLADSPHDVVRQILADTTDEEAVWKKLLETRKKKKGKSKTWDDYLQAALADKVTSGKLLTLQRGSESRYLFISKIAARSEKCPPSLVGHYAYYLMSELAKNPAIALQLLENPNALQPEEYNDWKVDKWLSEGNAPGHVANYFLLSDDIKRRRKATRSWTVLLANLQLFVLEDNIIIRKNIAERQVLTRFMFEILSRDEKPSVRELVAKNTACPVDILEKLANDKANVVRTAVLESADLRKLNLDVKVEVKNKGPKKDRLKMAWITNSPEILLQLAEDSELEVRRKVVDNENVSAAALAILSLDDDAWIRSDVARHQNTEEHVVKRLLDDANEGVRSAAMYNRCWFRDEEIDENRTVNHHRADVLDKMKDDEYEGVRTTVAMYTEDPELQRRYLTDPNTDIKFYLARNEFLSHDVSRELIKDKEEKVRHEMAFNIHDVELFMEYAEIADRHVTSGLCYNESITNIEIQKRLVGHKKIELRRAVVEHMDASNHELLTAFSLDPDIKVRIELSKIKKLPAKVVDNLLVDRDRDIIKTLYYNRNLTKRHVNELMQNNEDFKLMFAYQAHEKFILEKLITDEDPDVRQALTENYNLSEAQKQKLLEDSDERVAAKAKVKFSL